MAAEKESEEKEKVDCTFCPDAFTWYLAEQDLFDETTWLFDHKADYGIKDKDSGMTLLHAVCRDGHKDFAEMLIKRGAEINLPDNEGRTAIHYAVMSGNSALVESLILLGCDPNKLTKKKETPLHFAAKYSGLEEVKFLVEHGASIKAINWSLVENLKDQRRRQDKIFFDSNEERIIALKKALGLKTPEALQDEEEEEEEDEDEEGSSGNAKGNELATVDIDNIPVDLLPRDSSDAATIDGMTALHFAAQNGDTAVVQYLIEHGADVNAQDAVLSRTAIHFAAEQGYLDCIEYLTEHGANLQDKDSFGATAFHYAAKSNKLDVVKYLVSKKMDYTAKDVRGWTAMHYAAYGNSLDSVKYLLAKGLNINERNNSGRTPLFFARGHRELRRFMISKGAN
jgi:serine/threonine-protein phosphatase 6 regulatory ankyrin repeat subunit A/serine/threonine-protein phosphatase 6 regulatory ankyrin repeat subunit B